MEIKSKLKKKHPKLNSSMESNFINFKLMATTVYINTLLVESKVACWASILLIGIILTIDSITFYGNKLQIYYSNTLQYIKPNRVKCFIKCSVIYLIFIVNLSIILYRL